ncbi:MAG: hypothetical protein AAGF81_21805 [Pseudomonadota bacterium]
MTRRRSPASLVLLSLVFAIMLPGALRPAAADDPVILTVAGDIEKSNRGKFDPFLDGFLGYHDKEFKTAFELTAKELGELPQATITALGGADTWQGPVSLTGPRLQDVLALAGAQGKPVTVFALDGYGAEFDVKSLKANNWVLAHSLNGRRLSVGGRGPLWLAYETGDKPATTEEEAKWVWSVFYIEVQSK